MQHFLDSGLHQAELIDARIAQPRRKVSIGRAVKAMIVNALGFSGRALYLNPRFYENRPVEVLIGDGLTATDLHDASLGTAPDALYEHGITEVFYSVASSIARGLGDRNQVRAFGFDDLQSARGLQQRRRGCPRTGGTYHQRVFKRPQLRYM